MFNLYGSIKGKKSKTIIKNINIDEYINLIRTNYKVKDLRNEILINNYSKDKVDNLKTTLPIIIPNFYTNESQVDKRDSKHLTNSTGYIYFDVDKLDEGFVNELKTLLFEKFKSIKTIYKSFSGKNIGILFAISGLTIQNYSENFESIKDDLNDFINKYELGIDKYAKSAVQPHIISFDEDILVRDNSIIIKASNNKIPSSISIKKDKKNKYVNGIELVKRESYILNNGNTTNKQIFFKTQLDDENYDELGLKVNSDGFKFIDMNTYMIAGKIKNGSRNSIIGSFGLQLILNNPNNCFKNIFSALLGINTRICVEALNSDEVKKSLISNIKRYNNNEIDYSKYKFIVNRKIAKSYKSELLKEDYKKISMEELNYQKKQGSEYTQEIIQEAIILIKNDNKIKITKEIIRDIIISSPLIDCNKKISLITIKKYWKPFKEEIQIYNKQLKYMKNTTVVKEIKKDNPIVEAEPQKDIKVEPTPIEIVPDVSEEVIKVEEPKEVEKPIIDDETEIDNILSPTIQVVEESREAIESSVYQTTPDNVNVELRKENEKLKEQIKTLEFENEGYIKEIQSRPINTDAIELNETIKQLRKELNERPSHDALENLRYKIVEKDKEINELEIMNNRVTKIIENIINSTEENAINIFNWLKKINN